MNAEVSRVSCNERTLDMPNGTSLVFRTFRATEAPRAAVIIPSAMGVAQKYYTCFAQWLASQGYEVTTFDYRGIGQSAPRSLRGYPIDIFDWATQDCATVIDVVKAQLPAVPL
jgi:predicted alpha/beta hydrolase